jgi:hypothetical protein
VLVKFVTPDEGKIKSAVGSPLGEPPIQFLASDQDALTAPLQV